eukprot:24534-Amphidinium_carterae.1
MAGNGFCWNVGYQTPLAPAQTFEDPVELTLQNCFPKKVLSHHSQHSRNYSLLFKIRWYKLASKQLTQQSIAMP